MTGPIIPENVSEANNTEDVTRVDFLNSELKKLRCRSAADAAPHLADADDLLDVAIEQDPDEEMLNAVVCVVTHYTIDWSYQYCLANKFGHRDRLNCVRAKAGLDVWIEPVVGPSSGDLCFIDALEKFVSEIEKI